MHAPRTRTPRAARRGTTLIELAIGMSLFAAVSGALFLAIDRSTSSYGAEATGARLDAQGRRVLDTLGGYLREADLDSVTPAGVVAPASTSFLDYQRPTGFAAGVVVWGPTERIVLELDSGETGNGLDDDGDGRIDEQRLVWISDVASADAVRVVLCPGVSSSLEGELAGNGVDDNDNGLIDEPGFCLVSEDSRLTVRLTLEELDREGRRTVRSVERSIMPRNTPED